MTPELSQRLDSILVFIETTLKQTKDFTLDQAPDVIRQFLGMGTLPERRHRRRRRGRELPDHQVRDPHLEERA